MKDSESVEYIYECGCRTAEWKPRYPGPTKICPEHGDRMAKKVRWCLVCGKECIVSKKCSSKKYICDEHRPEYNLKIKRVHTKKWYKKRRISQAKAPEGKVVDPEWEATKHLRILEARFPSPVMPAWSPAMDRIINARQIQK